MSLSQFGAVSGNFAQNLTVTPEVLVSKAGNVRKKVRETQTLFSELDRCMMRTNGFWKGEAGDAHRQKYDSKKSDIDEIFKRLGEDVADLIQMAGVYSAVEKEVAEIANDLPNDVIV